MNRLQNLIDDVKKNEYADVEKRKEVVETLIDDIGINELLVLMSEICYAKEEHVATNWQDARLAKAWAKDGALLYKMSHTKFNANS